MRAQAVHYEKVTKLKQRIEQGDDFDPDSPDDRKIVRELFLHAADIGNIAKVRQELDSR